MKALLSLLTSLLATTASSHPASRESSAASPRLPSEFYKRQCDCYVASGPEPGYFENYAFWDFRKIPLPRNQAKNKRTSTALFGTNKNHDDERADEDGDIDDDFDSDTLLLSQTAYAKDWVPQTWHRNSDRTGPVPMVNSPRNVFFARNPFRREDPLSTHLVLRATRFPDHTAIAEVEHYLRNIFHCSLRVRMRIMSADSVMSQPSLYGRPVPNVTTAQQSVVPRGACVGIFTYRSAECESDIEILTSDPQYIVRYANQPDYDLVTDTVIPEAGAIGLLPRIWTNPITYRVDWLRNVSRWYADNQMQASKTYRVPDQPSIVAINLWSNGGEWTGDMSVGQSVYIGIEWIEMAYNTSTNSHSVPDDLIPLQRHQHKPMIQFTSMEREPESEAFTEEIESFAEGSGRECRRPCFLDDIHYP